MAKPTITKRAVKAAALTYAELDTNFQNLADATLTLTGGSTAVTADLNGTITLVAGTGVTITGDNSAKTITITNGSLGANAFGKIVVAGQSDVDADTTGDTLTLAAGSNITLTTNASTDTVTIAASVTGVTNPLAADLTLGSFKIIDTNGEATIQSTQGLMVKSNAYANAEVTITPGDISNATSRISTKEGNLTINTNSGGSVRTFITLDPGAGIDMSASDFGLAISFSKGVTQHVGITTTQRNAISAPANGMIIYNSSTDKFQGRAAGAWVDLH
jgi:hypothetical protein